MTVLQRLRNALAESTAGSVLRRLGVARPALRLYERAVLRRGTQTLAYNGSVFTFAAHDRFDVSRVDSFLGIERHFIDRIRGSTRPQDIMFDVGANIGIVSVLIAATNRRSGVAVHAFEPNPETAGRARHNAELNRCENVTVHTVALGRQRGAGRLFTCGGDSGRDSMVDGVTATANIRIRVERGDEVARRLGIEPSLVKIDVEGAEMDVLLGMEELLVRGSVRELFIEVHPSLLRAVGQSGTGLVAWLESRGFCRVWRAARGNEIHEHFCRVGSRRQ